MPTPELETAAALAKRAHMVLDTFNKGMREAWLVGFIEARDAAVARRVLDELEASACITPGCDCWRAVVIPVLREKYAEPAGRKEET